VGSMKNPSPAPMTPPAWMNSATGTRLWLSYWPILDPAVHTLKLTTVKIHEYGVQFQSDHPLPFGTSLQLRLLLPPMTAIALQGLVIHEESLTSRDTPHQISVRFTTIRDSDRQRLVEFTRVRRVARLRDRAAIPCPSSQLS